jgi:predicted DNA-binding protein (MmcQ/YjbR family)
MDLETYREFCLSLKCTTEGTPFGDDVLVFKVMDKMFSLADLTSFKSINLKCDPEKAIELREHYLAVTPGYHMNKKHWNTVEMDGTIPDDLIKTWTLDSYNLIVKSLPKAIREKPQAPRIRK